MATYYSDFFDSSGNPTGQYHVGPNCLGLTVTTTAALADGDELHFIELQPGFKLIEAKFYSRDLDTDGSPALAASFGPQSDTDLFGSNLTFMQATQIYAGNWAGDFYGYESSTTENLILEVTTSAATGAAGYVHLALFFTT